MTTDSVRNEDTPFRHYTLKHRAVAWVSSRLFDNAVYTVRHGLIKGLKRRGGLGWVPAAFSGNLETAEHHFWNKLDLRDKTIYDVGSFQGLLALFFATRARAVVCFEPNNRNHARLLENLSLNNIKNVQVRKTGIGSHSGTMQMAVHPLMPGGSSVDEKTVEQLLHSGTATIEQIPMVTIDEEVVRASLPPPDFIKIDIEGWELEALLGARGTLVKHHPDLFLEMHGETLREKKAKVAAIVAFLWETGYHDILHVQTKTQITPENSLVAIEGHLFCRVATK